MILIQVGDLHRHFIDDITIPSSRGAGVLRRVDDVFDCWFESGSMPYAQVHYPFENKDFFQVSARREPLAPIVWHCYTRMCMSLVVSINCSPLGSYSWECTNFAAKSNPHF